MNAEQLHRDAIIVDATCPPARMTDHIDWWREGGATAIAPTVTGMNSNARSGFAMIGGWQSFVRERNDTILVLAARDIEAAKQEGKLGLILHCQGTAIVEDDLDLLDAYQAAGLRFVQLRVCRNHCILVQPVRVSSG